MQDQNVLVVSAHTADWLWRSGGTIAKYIEQGANVHVVCLTYGARGESNELWKAEGQTLANVEQLRKAETEKAAGVIGIRNLEFWGYNDHMFEITSERLDRMMIKMRTVRPHIVLTHDKSDILNPDHGIVSEYVLLAGRMANSAGIVTEGLKTAPSMAIFGFEMSNADVNDFKPSVYVDITDVWEKKLAAMNCIEAQKKTVEVHVRLNTHRAWQARGVSRNKECKFAEAFSSRFPFVVNEFPG
jgi:Uncharacterized proteins, LmbE homologs